MGNSITQPVDRKVTIEDFDFVRLVGKGAFGKVWQVRKKDTGQIFAMKVLSKKTIVEQNLVQHTVFERDVMLTCNNPFIVNLYYAFQTDDALHFVLDFVGGGSLFTVLRDHPQGYFPESQAKFYAAEILLGLEELHRNEIVYRDLKLENILIGTDGHTVLTDFGLSAKLDKDNDKIHSFSGTAIYIAPEVLIGEGHDKNVDWWSYGVLLHLLLTGEPPFWSENRRELFEMILLQEAEIDDPLLSPEAKDLIEKLLIKEVENRLGCTHGAVEIKKHAFFNGINWNNVLKKKLKPPFIPSEFLLTTTRQIPSVAGTPPANAGGSGSSSHDDEQNGGSPFNIDHFEGFSFVAPGTEKQPTANVASLNSILFVGKPRLKAKKRRSKPVPESRPETPTAKDQDGFTLKKLELLREQAARDNRNRTFISVGDSASSAQHAVPTLTKSSLDIINSNTDADADLRNRSKKSKKSRFRRTVSVGTIQRSDTKNTKLVGSDNIPMSPR